MRMLGEVRRVRTMSEPDSLSSSRRRDSRQFWKKDCSSWSSKLCSESLLLWPLAATVAAAEAADAGSMPKTLLRACRTRFIHVVFLASS